MSAELARELAQALGLEPLPLSDASGTACLDVPAQSWGPVLAGVRERGYDFLDWLSAVDEPLLDPPAVDVVAHVVHTGARAGEAAGTEAAGTEAGEAVAPRLRRVLLRTRLPAADPVLASATGVWAGAAWHERETAEMFGVTFEGFDDGSGAGLRPLLLPDGFEGTPLRKSFVLVSRATKAWPGAKEPGESDAHAAPSRRKTLPPGVPDAQTWGPRPPAGRPGEDARPREEQPGG